MELSVLATVSRSFIAMFAALLLTLSSVRRGNGALVDYSLATPLGYSRRTSYSIVAQARAFFRRARRYEMVQRQRLKLRCCTAFCAWLAMIMTAGSLRRAPRRLAECSGVILAMSSAHIYMQRSDSFRNDAQRVRGSMWRANPFPLVRELSWLAGAEMEVA